MLKMSNESSALLAEHEEFNSKMENAKTEEEAAIILEEFLSSTAGELPDYGELSEEQLEAVSGGAKWKVGRPGVPVFNKLPGGVLSSCQKIIRVLDEDTVIYGKLVRDRKS